MAIIAFYFQICNKFAYFLFAWDYPQTVGPLPIKFPLYTMPAYLCISFLHEFFKKFAWYFALWLIGTAPGEGGFHLLSNVFHRLLDVSWLWIVFTVFYGNQDRLSLFSHKSHQIIVFLLTKSQRPAVLWWWCGWWKHNTCVFGSLRVELAQCMNAYRNNSGVWIVDVKWRVDSFLTRMYENRPPKYSCALIESQRPRRASPAPEKHTRKADSTQDLWTLNVWWFIGV